MERLPAPPPLCLGKLPAREPAAPPGLDFAHMYQVYKPRRGLKRSDDAKETYKLPHRLIEKKRRDRINECIAQLKDLLPEHLKLTTLGHLEKAVVLELTLKHVKALTNLIEQQQQKIVALQSGLQAGDLSPRSLDSSQEMFRSGFQMCAKEMLQYLAKHEGGKELKGSQLAGHLHRLASEGLPAGRKPPAAPPQALGPREKSGCAAEGQGKNCVPVIQRTFAPSGGEQSGSDTDTDSGYGGELEKSDPKSEEPYFKKDTELRYAVQERIGSIKQETEDPPAKRTRMETPEDDGPFGGDALGPASGFLGAHAHQPPLCLPFYLIPPSATAYLPMLEKCWYPASVPVLYPSLPASAAALSGFVSPDKISPPLLMPQRLPSPAPAPSPLDSSALLQALKHIPPLNLETKD
ncbi:class E basic helix-loop-helix protein 40 isoform X2 [Dromaius novaehollandiae]|uniref:class E basic helix-loop-helix protein 40 isoform X2 n=1 Tax=Dromaius novaehollandiae TaxID=8790 RepID=UPI00311E1432